MIKKQNNHVPLRPLSDQLRTIELKFFILSCSPTLIRQVTIIIYNAVFSEIRYIGNMNTKNAPNWPISVAENGRQNGTIDQYTIKIAAL